MSKVQFLLNILQYALSLHPLLFDLAYEALQYFELIESALHSRLDRQESHTKAAHTKPTASGWSVLDFSREPIGLEIL